MKIVNEDNRNYLLTEEEYCQFLTEKVPAYYFRESEEKRLDAWLFWRTIK